MSSSVPGHASPGVGFEAPLEMLSACHHRIERQCSTLRRLAQHLATRGNDPEAREAAGAVLRYFQTAAAHHHADEEENLFPALIESMAGSDAVCLRELTEGLAADHRELEIHWQRVRIELNRVAAGDGVSLTASDVDAFVSAYQRHIAREEGELLPMAARLLSDDVLDSIGRAMRERRGIGPID
ncbi:MAG TPA: hemerythrin domain-containing protein [Lautropia sp.]|jgi:hemerythrin-like domain-containing protein|nr:hemerythrin domain-containing protein [Lautropia sp.]